MKMRVEQIIETQASPESLGIRRRRLIQLLIDRLRSGFTYMKTHKRKIGLAFFGVVVFWCMLSVLWQPKASFAFSSSDVCVRKLVILPGLHKPLNEEAYRIDLKTGLSVFGLELMSRRVCATAESAPKANQTHTTSYSLFGNRLIKQKLHINTPAYPRLAVQKLAQPVAASKPLVLPIDMTDKIFDYTVDANQKSISCSKSSSEIICPLKDLELAQGKEYETMIVRKYKGEVTDTVYKGNVRTADPVRITSYSVPAGSLVYEKLTQIKLTADKEISSFEGLSAVRLTDSGEQPVQITAEVTGSELLVVFSEPLERRSSFRVKINQIQSTDNGQLDAPILLDFRTSGGPSVKGVNIGTTKVDRGGDVVVTFDQPLATTQNISKFISFTTAGGAVPFTVRIQNSRVVISPQSLAACTSYTITVQKGIESIHGIVGDTAWAHRFRTRCAVITTIGYSVNGRAIQAYSFGSGASKILYVGGMHGNEKSSYHTMNSWIEDLENNPDRIPTHRTVIVVPNSNPDGTAASRRTNSNNVDLNRNFPADDWTAGVYMPGPTFAPQGGGAAPLSEPESKALSSFVQSIRPQLVLTFHGAAAVVIANGSGDSSGLAATYAGKSRYSVASDSQADDIFSYTTTGEFEDWLHDKLGIPALLIEHATTSSNEFARNRDALWAMVALP